MAPEKVDAVAQKASPGVLRPREGKVDPPGHARLRPAGLGHDPRLGPMVVRSPLRNVVGFSYCYENLEIGGYILGEKAQHRKRLA